MDGEATEEPDLCNSPGPLEIALDCSSVESSSCEAATPSPREPSPVELVPPLAINDASRKKMKKTGRRFAESLSMQKKKRKKERDSAAEEDTVGRSARAPRKRKSYSVTEKLALVAEVEAGRKKVDICREYGISASTLASITKHKEQFMAAYEESRLKAKRLRKATREDLDRALLRWYHQATASGTPISGPLLQAKAEKIAAELGYENRTVPNAWIDRFKKRHAITYARERKEMGADIPDVDTWLNTSWPQIRSGYSSWDIFSAVETGLFFRALPKEAAQLNGATCEQGQLAQDRFTIYLCTNMTGDERRPLTVVGASPLPHSVVLPGLTYSVNEKSWMTRRVFVEELRRWDRELEARKRKVLLLVDQTVCHELGKKANLRRYPRSYRSARPCDFWPSLGGTSRTRPSGPLSGLVVCTASTISMTAPKKDGDHDETDDPLELWSSHYDLPEDLVDGIGEFENIDEFVATSAKLQTDQVGEDAGEQRLSLSKTDGNTRLSKKADSIASYEVLDAIDLLLKYCDNSPLGISRTDAEKAALGLNALRASAQVTAFKRTYSLNSK
ncbi:hypothetical protein MRX96_023554 [Rhipicephalus microplus]